MRGPKLSQILLLLFVLALGPATAFSQLYYCVTMQGTWTWSYDGSQYNLSQDASGNVTGNLVTPFCIGQQFPVTGTISSGSFTFTVTDLETCPGTFNSWTTFAGYIGQPGCNYAYGNWTNSLGNSGGFGQNSAYPTSGAFFTKAVDVPTVEKSVQSGTWSTTMGAPWHQTLGPNSPPGEFSGRIVYEYFGGAGTDLCHFQGSIFAPFDAVTTPGFGWDVNGKNLWGADFVGYKLAAVQYYRAQNRTPCSSRFPQQMVIDAAYSPDNPASYGGPYTDNNGYTFYGVVYETDGLGGDITAATVASIRNGQIATNTTWK